MKTKINFVLVKEMKEVFVYSDGLGVDNGAVAEMSVLATGIQVTSPFGNFIASKIEDAMSKIAEKLGFSTYTTEVM